VTKKKKIRAELRKNRQDRAREADLTRGYQRLEIDEDSTQRSERVVGKRDAVRKRTIHATAGSEDQQDFTSRLEVDLDKCLPGRVISAGGLHSLVQTTDGRMFKCATRRLLKSLLTTQRHVVATGDRVYFRPSGTEEGIIERIEPRSGVLARTSKGRMHVLVANVDFLMIIASAAEPDIKPHLIDRMLVTAEVSGMTPLICVNKVDLIDPAELQPLLGVYGQLGYRTLMLSTVTGQGIDILRWLFRGKQSVVSGQSGVGKSSLLNAIQPGLDLRVRTVSEETEKGRHTTTAAVLIPLEFGGWVVDTPGIRQFQLWDVIPDEIASYFRELRPYVTQCRFPDCSHTHEQECAVKDAVADGKINLRRYESYCHMRSE
jgi:ribosome biogenesis GTPase / thiamine phosphate phosphatase